MTHSITLYSKPNCPQCKLTKDVLERLRMEYTIVDVTVDSEAYKFVTGELGYMAAPVVVADSEHWSGFRPDKLEQLAARVG